MQGDQRRLRGEIGRASCRERVESSGVAVSFKKRRAIEFWACRAFGRGLSRSRARCPWGGPRRTSGKRLRQLSEEQRPPTGRPSVARRRTLVASVERFAILAAHAG